MTWLQWSLRTLRKIFPSGPYRAVPWMLVKYEVMLSKCQCSARFLTACRRISVVPKCISNCSKATKLFGSFVSPYEERFQAIILQKMIEEKFRRIRYLKNRCETLRAEVRTNMRWNDAKWSIGHSKCMAWCTMTEESERLRCKLNRLKEKKRSVAVLRRTGESRRECRKCRNR